MILSNSSSSTAGKYQPSPHFDPNVECTSCAAGLYISDDGQIEPEHNSATDCKYCTTGKEFVSAITVCQICGAGKYQSTNNLANASCIACVGRYILDDRQIDTEHDSQDDCTFCSTGKEFVSTTEVCQICAAGKFQSANDAVGPSCETCVGLYILDDRQIDTEHDSQEDCKYCTTGKEFVSAITVCRICDAGKYQGANNVLGPSCKDCDVGLYIEDDSTIDSEHASCKFCPLGREYVDLVSVCTICLAGKYQSSRSTLSVSCSDCPSGKYLVDASADAANHATIQNCTNCGKVGYEYTSATQPCKICSGGRYQNQDNVDDLKCKLCSASKFIADDVGDVDYHDDVNDCIPCQDRTFSPPGSRFCQNCPAGKRTTYPLIATVAVTWGVPNETSNPCKSYCELTNGDCDIATDDGCFSANQTCVKFTWTQSLKQCELRGSAVCQECATGHFQPLAGKEFCTGCPAGYYQPTNGTAYCKFTQEPAHRL